MAKKGEARQRITLQCTVCKSENARTEKNKRNTTERLELNKYCPKCRKVTVHKEQK
jgi:large subunit ribosomal protein L33